MRIQEGKGVRCQLLPHLMRSWDKALRVLETLILYRGVQQLVASRPHKSEVGGSSPLPASSACHTKASHNGMALMHRRCVTL